MTVPFRVIDTGVDDGRRHMAFDEALIELHKAGRIGDTVRFMRFPPTVLIGRHQVMAHEVHVDRCRTEGIGLVRRITGGGAIYLDEGQVGWELVLSRRRLPMPGLADYTRAICEAVAYGLGKAFGIAAIWRPRSDIVVDGRKLCGTGGFFDGDTLIYQGTVLVDVAPSRLLDYLNVPAPVAGGTAADRPEARIATLEDLLGEAPDVFAVEQAVIMGLAARLGIAPVQGVVTDAERSLAGRRYDEEVGSDAFVFGAAEPRREGTFEGVRVTPGGTVRAFLRLEGRGGARRIREALITGDFFVTPPRVVLDLEGSLRGVTVDQAGAATEAFLAARRPEILTVPPAEIRAAVEAACAADNER